MAYLKTSEKIAFLTMNTFYKMGVVEVPLHPSIHTCANANPIALADHISRMLIRYEYINRGDLTFRIDDANALHLLLENTKPYHCKSDEMEDDPDVISVDSATRRYIIPNKKLYEVLDHATSCLFVQQYIGCLQIAEPFSQRYTTACYIPSCYVRLREGQAEADFFAAALSKCVDGHTFDLSVSWANDWYCLEIKLK